MNLSQEEFDNIRLKRAFYDACWRGSINIVKLLSKKFPTNILKVGRIYAEDNEKTEVIKFLDEILSFNWKKEGF